MKNAKIEDCQIIQLPKLKERDKGAISFVENLEDVPFIVKRIFYLYDIPGGESRGAHAHMSCEQFLVAVSGSFSVEIDDGQNSSRYFLNNPSFGLYIPSGIWASEEKFSSGSTCLVLASKKFDERDYIRDYKIFTNKKKRL